MKIFRCTYLLPLKLNLFRFYNWWSSPIGQKVSGFAMLGGSVLAAGYQLAPHTGT